MSKAERFSLPRLLRAGAAGGIGQGLSLARGVKQFAATRLFNHLSIGQVVEAHARRHPDKPALRFADRVYSYAEFNAGANRYAAVLREAGVGMGDVVAILMENRPETLLAVTATVKLGAIAAMCNTKQRGEVLAHSLALVQPAAVLVDADLQAAFDEVREELGFAAADRVWLAAAVPAAGAAYRDLDAEAGQQSPDNPATTATVDKNASAFYVFTSGTTGLPKASRMSHLRWLRAGAGLGLGGMGLTGGDVLYCCLPLYHNNALTVSWGAVLAAGATLALAPKFSVSGFWEDIRAHRATAFCYIGELCRYLLRAPSEGKDHAHAVRTIIGNGLRPDIWDEFKTRFGIERVCEFYGASEGNLVFVNAFNLDRTAGFCPLPFAVVKYDVDSESPVRDATGRMQQVAKGGVGLLLTKVTNSAPFEGYTDAAASEKKLYRDVFKAGDCYFDTGDLVRDQGMRHIAFVDRLGDTFRWKGENVATTEVENALDAHPAIADSVVYGVQLPGADGRAGMAAVTVAGKVDWASLAAQLRARLPAYAVPVFIRVKGEQAVTGTFKFRKVELKEQGFAAVRGQPVYFLAPGADSYTRLDANTRRQLQQGKLGL